MRKFSLTLLSLSLGMGLMAQAIAASSAQQQLLEQVRLGETTRRDDLVRQSLGRLELIDPNNPDVIAARLRYLLRQGDAGGAQKQLERLATLAPDSAVYQTARATLELASPDGRQALQQARLLATAGRNQEAVAAYDKLFKGLLPQGDLGVEYWTLVAKLPPRRTEAIGQLQALNASEPGNNVLQTSLAQLLFADGRDEEGFTVLQQMAKAGTGREAAAGMWYQRLENLPASPQSVAAVQRFLSVFSTGEIADKARVMLARLQSRLADPAFRARSQGIAEVETGRGAAAIAPLQQAINAGHNDGETLGALGQAYSQQGDRVKAVTMLTKALAMAPQSDNHSKWQSLLRVNRYWLLIEQGDAALKNHDLAAAERKYRQAQGVDNADSYAVLGLGDVAVARQDDAAAERFYLQALRMDAGNDNAVRGLANLYRRQSPERASAFLAQLSARQRRGVADIGRSLADARLEQQASALEAAGQFAGAARLQRERLALDPGSVWVTYRLAQDLYRAGQHGEADAQFRRLVQEKPGDVEQVYAYGLYLSGTGRVGEALAHLDTLPRDRWNGNIHELAARLQSDRLLASADRLRDGGNEAAAIALLQRQPASDRIDLTLADWAQQRGDGTGAKMYYQRVLQRSPHNEEALLGLAEVYAAAHDNVAARVQLAKLENRQGKEALSLNAQRRIAVVQAATGDNGAAQQTFGRIVPQARTRPPSMENALVLRDSARFQGQINHGKQALDDWRDAMVAGGMTDRRPDDNDTFTRLTRSHAQDDWLKRGIRSDAADSYRQQDINVTLTHDYWGSSGTPGYSDLTAHTTMLQVDAPLYDGRMFFRSDRVNMDAGQFSRDDNGLYRENWGTCAATWCSGRSNSTARGASVALGWRNRTWNIDIGTTPMGFNVVDVTGGLSYSADLGPLGYTLNVHRRPVSSSLLAFAGQTDPNTNTRWGGVRASGGGVSVSYDKGGAHGVWSSLNADALTGKNVEDNWRVRWMSGYYYKLLNENNQRLTVGLNNMLWRYDKDLSGYSLGQGGYYSPQQYLSFAVPVVWRKRTENWSWELGGSASWSYAKTADRARYPLKHLIPAPVANEEAQSRFTDKYMLETGDSSSGIGYTARALVERRISSRWSIGAGIDIQEAKDYTPSHALIFVRWSQAGWQGDMDMPPQPLEPYADW